MTAEDKARYDGLFASYDRDGDGFIQGAEAVPIFNQSGLDVHVLRSVWSLADDDKDSRLTKDEFAVAFHLILCIGKKGLPLPPGLPAPLRAFLASGSIAAPAESPAVKAAPAPAAPQVLPVVHSDPPKQTVSQAFDAVEPPAMTVANKIPDVRPSKGAVDATEVEDMASAVSSMGDAAKKLSQSQNTSMEASEKTLSSLKSLAQRLNTERIALAAAAANAESNASALSSKLARAVEDLAGGLLLFFISIQLHFHLRC
jgi:hypothetical protein